MRRCPDCGWMILKEDVGICPKCAAEDCGCGRIEGCIDDGSSEL